jgi:MoxR-like ATPase
MTSMVAQRHQISERLAAVGYIADRDLATSLWLMDLLNRPLLLEGEAGVGKTEVAKALSAAHGYDLIRLQCYEGLDQNAALYEWNYQRQILAIKTHESRPDSVAEIEAHIFSEPFLLERPILAAVRSEKPVVLLIDEVDRADEEFEAFLLEFLSEYQVTIPELGTIKARSTPRVVLTSNGSREISDALRRRCLYHYVDFPQPDREAAIIRARHPEVEARLAIQVARLLQAIRKEELRKAPGVAETLDFVVALSGLGEGDLTRDPDAIHEILTTLLKTREDQSRITREVVSRLVANVA